MQRALQSLRKLSLLVVRNKQWYSKLNTWWCTDQVIFHIKPAYRFCFHGNKSPCFWG